ncbi:HSP20-like chaperone [Abortiporus biennis]|nr:HSP20-like chaperone [Abortiporus biennis]
MSIARQFFREFRPFFRMLEEPITRSPAYAPWPRQTSLFEDPFFTSPNSLRPAVDVTEDGNNYVVEADLPGVKKENVEVRIGDGGRSITIEGKVVSRSPEPQASTEGTDTAKTTPTAASTAVTTAPTGNQLTTERSFVGSSTFTRTVWLPRPIDSSNVSATLNDGVLTVKVPKAEDKGSVSIPVQ